MKLYRVGDRLINLDKISYAEKLADSRVWCIIDGQPLSIDAPDGDLIFGLLENQIPKTIKPVGEKDVKWAIAFHPEPETNDTLLINDVGILQSNCQHPMLFDNQIKATEWLYQQGIRESLKIIRWAPEKLLVGGAIGKH